MVKYNAVLSQERREEVARRYVAGENVYRLSEEYGITRAAIRGNARRRGTIFPDRTSRRYSVNQAAFDELTPETSYWIGFLMADGNVSETLVQLRLAEKDAPHIERFRSFLGSNHPIHTQRPTPGGYGIGTGSRILTIHSRRLVTALAMYGVIPRKSLIGKSLGLENDRDFWRGVIDGDGGLYLRNGGRRQLFLCGGRPILEQFQDFLRTIIPGVAATISRNNTILSCRIYNRNADAAVRHIYYDGCVALGRRMAKVQHFRHQVVKST